MTSDIERELLKAEQPHPPAALRQRVLAAATPLVQPPVSRLDAIWFSRGWRLAAVLVFFSLIAADALSDVTGKVPIRVDDLPVSSSVAVAVQAAIDLGLEEADVAAIAAQVASPTWTTDVDATRGGGMELTGEPQ